MHLCSSSRIIEEQGSTDLVHTSSFSTKMKVSRLFPQTLHLFDGGLPVTHVETSQQQLGIIGIIDLSPFVQVQNMFLPHILLLYFCLCKVHHISKSQLLITTLHGKSIFQNFWTDFLPLKHQCKLLPQLDLPHPNDTILLIPKTLLVSMAMSHP